jgi:RNA polymerase sigma-70 factor (ECF subfamily)
MRRTRDHHVAEELTQQVFADAAGAVSRGGLPRPTRAWLFTVAARRLVDELRRRGRDARVVDRLIAEPAAGTDEPLLSLVEALEALGEREQRLVVMRVVEGRTYREIASALGCSEAAGKMRLSRALARLRDELRIER